VFVVPNTTQPIPGTSFSPSAVAFPQQTVGTSSSPTPVTLTNTGAVALKVTNVTIAGTNSDEFSQTNNCTVIQPLTTCTINVTFSPSAAGAASANLDVADNAGTGLQMVPLSGTGAGSPDFTIGPASGSQSSQTVTAGQRAMFNLALTPLSGFSGTADLTCAITPAETPAPTCTLPGSVQLSGSNASPASVTVGTTASVTAGTVFYPSSPTGRMPFVWMFALLVSGFLFPRNRRGLRAVATSSAVLSIILFVSCGGGGSGSSHTTPGTPPGTYTVKVTATSGSLKHSTTLTVIVQ